ncbi:MAG: carboxypeptidase regulatory-like domain-containing protein, partial [Acidobacteria bacterium]|nr:carboxypeptidase regulatory-like domain-containing protein [Acidobacteriota bacterium]
MKLPPFLLPAFSPLTLLLSAIVFSGNAYSGSYEMTLQGVPKRWKSFAPVSCSVHPAGVPEFGGELQKLVVAGAINDAFRAWSEIPEVAVRFGPLGAECGVTEQSIGGSDGANLVTFRDETTFSFPPGVLAITLVTAAEQPGPVALGSETVNAEFAGQILDADILFNPDPTIKFSPVGANNAIDMVAVAMHEAGHLLGLGHSGIFSSIMNPYAESASGASSRQLQTDDMITAGVLYPVATFAPSSGTISGKVTSQTGASIKAAHVIAIRHPGGVPVASQLTDGSGDYTIAGLPPGTYRVMAEPLDGPIAVPNFDPFFADGQADFATTFFGGLASPGSISFAAGQGAVANIVLPSPPANRLNITQLGLITQPAAGQFLYTYGPNPLFLPRGNLYQVFVTADHQTNDSNLSFSGTGITGGPTLEDKLPVSGEPIRKQAILIRPDAALGPSNLMLSNASSTSAFPGGVITTASAALGLPVREGAGFGTTLAPGAIVSIGGSDLAVGRGVDGT